jgi:hypothetical protein
MKEQVYAKEVNNRDEFLIRINNVADIIRQTPNVYVENVEKTWSLLHRCVEKCIVVNRGYIQRLL